MAPANSSDPVLQAVLLNEGYKEIITRHTANNPNFNNKNLPLWPVKGYNKTPATTKMGQMVDLTLIFSWKPANNFPESYGINLAVSGKLINSSRFTVVGGAAEIRSENLPQEKIAVPVKLWFSGPGDVPWGLNDQIAWTFRTDFFPWSSGDKFVRTGTFIAPIEIYGIVSDVAQFYNSGIPLDLLRKFVEPATKNSRQNLAGWIKWVVERCHASRVDEDCKLPEKERLHSFRYDVWAGAAAYRRGPWGQEAFFVDDWLDDAENAGGWNILNCYDQAAVVQVIVSLGVPGSQVKYIFKEPFGCIKKLDIVGWGFSNNPFFYAALQNKAIQPGSSIAQTSFGNHGFVGYQKDKGSSDLLILDACAGPATGDLSLTDYLHASIDNTENKTVLGFKYYNYKEAEIFSVADTNRPGIFSLNNDLNGDSNWSKEVKRGTGYDTFVDDATGQWGIYARQVATSSSKLSKVDTNKVFKEFRSAVELTVGKDVAKDIDYIAGKPRTKTYQDFSTGIHKLFYQRGLDVITKGSNLPPLVTFTLRGLGSPKDAQAEAESFIKNLTNIQDKKSLNIKDEQGDDAYVLRIEGRDHSRLNVVLYGNFMVYLDGSIERALMKELTTKTIGILSSSTGDVATIDDQLHITAPNTTSGPLKQGDQMSVDVNCPPGKDMDVVSTTNILFNTTTIRPEDNGGAPGKWKFNFVVVAKTFFDTSGKEVPAPKKDTLTFICFHKDTGVPGSKSIDVTLA